MSLRGQRFAFPSRGFVGVLMSAQAPAALTQTLKSCGIRKIVGWGQRVLSGFYKDTVGVRWAPDPNHKPRCSTGSPTESLTFQSR